MSGNGDKPKVKQRRRSDKPRRIPLLMLGSDGEAYACAPARILPRGVHQTRGVLLAIRLTRRERDMALDALQAGIKEASRLREGILSRKLDS